MRTTIIIYKSFISVAKNKSMTKASVIYVQKGKIIQEDYRKKEYDVESIVLKEKFNDNHRKAFEY